jgi:hypothetical protein
MFRKSTRTRTKCSSKNLPLINTDDTDLAEGTVRVTSSLLIQKLMLMGGFYAVGVELFGVLKPRNLLILRHAQSVESFRKAFFTHVIHTRDFT